MTRYSTVPATSSTSSFGGPSRLSRHGVAPSRGQPTGVPQTLVEKDSRAAARGAGISTNDSMPGDYQVCVCVCACVFKQGLKFKPAAILNRSGKNKQKQNLADVDHNQLYDPLPFKIVTLMLAVQRLVYMILNGKGSSNWLWSIYIAQSCFHSFLTGQSNIEVCSVLELSGWRTTPSDSYGREVLPPSWTLKQVHRRTLPTKQPMFW